MPLDDYVAKIGNAGNLQERIKIINEALSDKEVHVFGELLNHAELADLQREAPQAHQLLQLFAYGTYGDYVSQSAAYPELRAEQLRKLRRLSVVQAARTQRSLPYADLLARLGLSTVPELEDLIIEMVTLGVLQGKLDQRNQQLHVHSSIGRDVPLSELPRLIESLQAWADTCRQSLGLVCSEMEAAERRHADAQGGRRQLEERIEAERQRLQCEQPMSAAAGHDAAEATAAAAQVPASSSSSASSVKAMKKVKLSGKK